MLLPGFRLVRVQVCVQYHRSPGYQALFPGFQPALSTEPDSSKMCGMAIGKDTIVRVSPDTLFREVGGEMVLLDLRSEHYFGLDAVGAEIWSLLESGLTVGETIERMLTEYEVEEDQIEADVLRLVRDLVDASLIEVSPD